jgi:hypothetical protein
VNGFFSLSSKKVVIGVALIFHGHGRRKFLYFFFNLDALKKKKKKGRKKRSMGTTFSLFSNAKQAKRKKEGVVCIFKDFNNQTSQLTAKSTTKNLI